MKHYSKPEVSVLGSADAVIQDMTGKFSNVKLDTDGITRDVKAAYDLDD